MIIDTWHAFLPLNVAKLSVLKYHIKSMHCSQIQRNFRVGEGFQQISRRMLTCFASASSALFCATFSETFHIPLHVFLPHWPLQSYRRSNRSCFGAPCRRRSALLGELATPCDRDAGWRFAGCDCCDLLTPWLHWCVPLMWRVSWQRRDGLV